MSEQSTQSKLSSLSVVGADNDFAWIGSYKEKKWHPDFNFYHSAHELIESAQNPELIILSLDIEEIEELDAQLHELRKNDLTALSQIYVTHESRLSPYLANGIWKEKCLKAFANYKERKRYLKLVDVETVKNKLIAYLWLNEATIQPKIEPSKSYIFSYPLLSAFGLEPEETGRFLSSLQNNDWIAKDSLKNRVRYCASCHSGHLNYIDVCPKCESIDTHNQSSLHCFSCGHVGGEETFKASSAISCPNCMARLRHLGVDYDRPIEIQKCRSCENLFSESSVVAQCLHCHVSNPVDKLHIKNIHSYCLSSFGQTIARQGIEHINFTPEVGENMPISQFYWLVGWLDRLAQRHSVNHCIISLAASNLSEFLSEKGEVEGMLRLDAIKERLQSVVRMTDACCNDAEGNLLMLLPMTKSTQLGVVMEKLESVKNQQHDQFLELEVKVVELPGNVGSNAGAWLTDTLNSTEPKLL